MTTIKLFGTIIGAVFILMSVYAQNIDIMSYNIGSSNWSTTKDSVIGRVTANDPDIFCAIEATMNTRPYLESELVNYQLLNTFGATPNLSESHIFYRKNMFTVIDSGYVEMETYGGYTGPKRYVNWARFEELSSQKQFLVYASHFVFVFPSNPDSSTIGQYRHANGMIQLMDQHVSLNIPMITVGDFNADSSKAVMHFLLHQIPITYNSITITNPIVLNDSWYIANPSVSKPGTISSGTKAIDWILTTANTNVISAIIDNQGVDPGGDFPSDHLPLIITFNLSNTTAINMVPNDPGVRAFPNPFHECINFSIETILTEQISVQIFDATGKTISQREISAIKAGKHQIKIDLSDQEDGVYFYSIMMSGQQKTGTIIKTRS